MLRFGDIKNPAVVWQDLKHYCSVCNEFKRYFSQKTARIFSRGYTWGINNSADKNVYKVDYNGNITYGTTQTAADGVVKFNHQNSVSGMISPWLRTYPTGNIDFGVENVSLEHRFSGRIGPKESNKYSLGFAPNFWTEVYATTGAINTSDERHKQDIEVIPQNVIDAWRAVGFCQYRWRQAVAEKGVGARYHTGVIAQRIRDVFKERGLDAQDYGLLVYDQWPNEYESVTETVETVDETGQITIVERETGEQKLVRAAGDIWAIRGEECLFLEAESNRRWLADLETRLSALEKM